MSAGGDNQQNQKIANCKKLAYNMKSEVKNTRKLALVELEKYLSNPEEGFTTEDYHQVFNEVQMYTLNGLRDKSEPVREQAIKFARFFILGKLLLSDYYLSYVFPILLERLGSVEIIEESEEIRYQLLEFMVDIVEKYSMKEQLKPFLNDMVQILCETVKDKYPAIKETSCKCIMMLPKALPRDFNQCAETLIKPVLTAFGHQRYKIRVEAIKCIGILVMHSTYKGLEDVLVPMAERLFDQIPIVRKTVAQTAAVWLLEYKDRYSFFAKLLPLLLTGLVDEVPETRAVSYKLWHQVGIQYEKENEEELKDQINFLNSPLEFYAEDLERPPLGCRVLVQKNTGKIVPALSNELTSWQADVRVRCSQLLCAVVLHAEDGLTQHLQGILPAMYSTARDEDKRVVDNVIKAAELLGLFVSYDTWKKLILPAIEDGAHYGHLAVLAALIRGAPKPKIEEHLEEISKILADENVCWSRKEPYQKEMLNCVEAILSKLPSDIVKVDFYLFVIVVSMVSLKSKETTVIDINLLENVANKCHMSVEELWSLNLCKLLDLIQRDPKAWTLVSAERCIFETILIESKEAFGLNLQTIGDILVKTLDIDADPEARLQTFIALSRAFKTKEILLQNAYNATDFIEILIVNVFIPTLVWHAGATAEAMRTMAASCLLSLLETCDSIKIYDDTTKLKNAWEQLNPLLISLAEDASSRSRALSLENLITLKDILVQNNIWSIEDLVKVYPEIMKRLDDPTEMVRYCAIKAFKYIFDSVPEQFLRDTYKGHHELITDTLLTHFDDDDETFQKHAIEVFKVLGTICESVVRDKIRKHRGYLRNQSGLQIILKNLEDLKIES